MTPANSTSFAAYGAGSADSPVREAVKGFNVSVDNLLSSGGGISPDFLARHTTDRSLGDYSQLLDRSGALGRYTASAVDPVLSIPVRDDFVPTHLQWRYASEDDGSSGEARTVGNAAKIINNADNLAASASSRVCSRDADGSEGVLATLIRLLDESCGESGVVGEMAEAVTNVNNAVGSSSVSSRVLNFTF